MTKTKMAIIYDFDGTLAPGNMQEHKFLPDIGVKAKYFWEEVKQSAQDHEADEVLVYMNLMLKKAQEKNKSISKKTFQCYGMEIKFYEGVEEWFDRINNYAKNQNIDLQHYLISSGNQEIFEGTSIKKHFNKIYASKFMYDTDGIAKWPALVVNYTTKTQYLFRINKGVLKANDQKGVNEFQPHSERLIPFEHMIYIGDGDTDIPCFRLIKDWGGLSIAVYKPNVKKKKVNKLFDDGRVHAIKPANYKEDGELDKIVKAQINYISALSETKKLQK